MQFGHIAIPYLRGIGTIILLLTGLWAYNNYLISFVMFDGGYYQVQPPAALLSVDILKESFTNLNSSYGAAQSVIMTGLALGFVIVYLTWTQPREIDEAARAQPRGGRRLLGLGLTLLLALGLAVLLGDHLLKILAVAAVLGLLGLAIRLVLAAGDRLAVRILKWVGLGLFLALVLLPVYWLVISSLKSESEIRQATWLPVVIEWSNYARVWDQAPLGQFFGNSILASTSAMVLSVLCATLAGYAFSRFRFPRRDYFDVGAFTEG